MEVDEKDERILRAIAGRTRPYQDMDVAIVTGLSLSVARKHLARLKLAGLIDEEWKGDRGPFWRILHGC